jgi:hypothetical protein
MAVSYDLVLEDRMLPRAALQKRKRPFAQEVTEMVRHAVGYRSRAFVTFGEAIPLAGYDPESRRDLVTLAHHIQRSIGLLYKVLPTALVAAVGRPRMPLDELRDRIDSVLVALSTHGANLAVRSGADAVDMGVELLTARGAVAVVGGRLRVRDRFAMRYYGRTVEHLLQPRKAAH